MGKGFFLFLAPIAVAASSGAMATPAFPAGDHPLFKAAVAAEKCFGQPTTLLDRIRLAAALRRETHAEIHSWEVSEALNTARQAVDDTACADADKEAVLRNLRSALNPRGLPEVPVRLSQTPGSQANTSQ